MKVFPLMLIFLACGCAQPAHHYAGSSGSVYDKQAQPPQAMGKGSYDPQAPVPMRDYGNGGAPAPSEESPR
jgi:hypothetical protein